MRIKDISQFRKWIKDLEPGRKAAPQFYNENFMGYMDGDTAGFFQMYHGIKGDIRGFLRKEIEMADDCQAIYEFAQNAADSNSSQFYMLYDENYFLAINNGEVFSKEGIKSILNVGQSFGKTDPDKIGGMVLALS